MGGASASLSGVVSSWIASRGEGPASLVRRDGSASAAGSGSSCPSVAKSSRRCLSTAKRGLTDSIEALVLTDAWHRWSQSSHALPSRDICENSSPPKGKKSQSLLLMRSHPSSQAKRDPRL